MILSTCVLFHIPSAIQSWFRRRLVRKKPTYIDLAGHLLITAHNTCGIPEGREIICSMLDVGIQCTYIPSYSLGRWVLHSPT